MATEADIECFCKSNYHGLSPPNGGTENGCHADTMYRNSGWNREIIQIKHCVTKRDGNQVHPTKIEDHRAITEMFKQGNHEYHKFRIQEDKPLKAVRRAYTKTLL